MSYKELWSYEAPKAIEFYVKSERCFCQSPGGAGTYGNDDTIDNGDYDD